MHLTTSAADFSKETLVVQEEETYDAGVFERVEAGVVKLLKKPPSSIDEIRISSRISKIYPDEGVDSILIPKN